MVGDASWRVELQGVSSLQKALRVLGEPDAPFLRQALTESGRLLEGAVASRAPGGIASKVGFAGIRGTVGGGLRAVVKIDHPGGRSMEFGRVWYYRAHSAGEASKRSANITKFLSYSTDDKARRSAYRNLAAIGAGIGNNRPGSKRKKGSMKRGFRFRASPGQPARPYLGVVKGGAAIGAVGDQVREKLEKAIRAEWDRLADYK